MIAAVFASVTLALSAGATPGLTPMATGPASSFSPTTAHVSQQFVHTGAIRKPARIPGAIPWGCVTIANGKILRCMTTRVSKRWRAVVTVVQFKTTAAIVVDVRRR